MRVISYPGGKIAAEIAMRKPFDMHHHVRAGEILKIVGPMLARRFAGAIIMPNTVPPVTTAARVGEYRDEVLAVTGENFLPLMTMYLTDLLHPGEVERAIMDDMLAGVKYYPRGVTTNSESGIKDPAVLWTIGTTPYQVLRVLANYGKILLLHGADGVDASGKEIDTYEQEAHFLRETLPRIRDAHPHLKISLEHISTRAGAELLGKEGCDMFGGSLTQHHLLNVRQDTFRGGFNVHTFWIPPTQQEDDRAALRELAASGSKYVWLGSDSAPHPLADKEAGCCKGGVMTVHAGIELFAEAFDQMNALPRLEAFASLNGPRFFGIEPSKETITLRREPWRVNGFFSFETMPNDSRDGIVRAYRHGEMVEWKLIA